MKIIGLIGAFLILTGISLPGNLLNSYANDSEVLLRYANEDLGTLQSLNDFNIMKNNNDFNVTNDVNKGLIMTTGFGQASSVYLKEQMAVDQTSPGFSTYFVMNVYKLNTSSGDGYTFIIAADSNSLGAPGGGLGYSGINNSVAVEFDFYANGNEIIASSDIFVNGVMQGSPGTGFDGGFVGEWSRTPTGQLVRAFHTWIEYDYTNRVFELRVRPSDEENPSVNRPQRPSTPLIQRSGFNLTQVSQFFYAGFSAATGGAAQINGLKSWYFSNAFIPGGIDVTQPFTIDNEAPTSPNVSIGKVNDLDQLTLSGSADNIGVVGYQYRTPVSNWIKYEESVNLDALGTYQARSFDRAGNVSIPILISRFEIIYYINNLEHEREIIVQEGTTYLLDKSVILGNYQYTQWYASNNFTTQPLVSLNASSNVISVYGKPFQFRFTVDYQLNGGTSTESLPSFVELDLPLSVPTPTKVGHTFTGWYTNSNFTTSYDETTPLNRDTTLYARWSVNQYTFTVVSQFQTSPIAVLTLDYNSTITELPTPSQAGYTFEGWFDGDIGVTVGFRIPDRDVTILAKWSINEYTLSFVSNQGSTIDSLTVDYLTPITAPDSPTRTGYTFGGWFSNEGLTNPFTFTTMPSSDTTLYAQWIINQYTIRFKSGFDSIPDQQIQMDFNSEIMSLPTLSRPGYTFEGWFDGDIEVTVGFRIPDRDVTLQARWTALSSTIIFVSSSSTSIVTLTSGQTISALPSVDTKEGYTFLGWSLSPDDPSKLVDETTIIENGLTIRLYPVWTKNSVPLLNQPWIESLMDPSIELMDIITFTSVLLLGAIMLGFYVRKQYGNL